jgi:hypothetical protein
VSPKIPILGWIVAVRDIRRAHKAYDSARKTKSAIECDGEFRAATQAFDRVTEAFGWTTAFLITLVVAVLIVRLVIA